MSELDKVRTCALLHDIGKLECWAKRKPWSEHVFYTYKFVKACLGEKIAVTAMRHHIGPHYSDEYKPKTDVERIICLADNLASGADRREKPSHGTPLPSPPIELTHVLSSDRVRGRLEARDLAYLSQALSNKLGVLEEKFTEDSRGTYFGIFDDLSKFETESGLSLRLVPAETREPINDVSLWDHLRLTAAFATCIYLDSWRGYDVSNYRFALLSGDADRISSFIGESLRLPDLNARSELINEATDRVREFINGFLGPECILFAAGGSFLALCPRHLAEKTLNEAKKVFEEATKGRVSITVSYVVAGGDEFQRSFGKVWESSQQKMRVKKSKRLLIHRVELDESVEICDVCKVRPWSREDKLKVLPFDAAPRFERLCDSCWELRKIGKRVELDNLKDERNFVACIKADGDNIGKILSGKVFRDIKKVSTPSRISTVSDIIHRTCEDELQEIIEKFSKRQSVIYAGGDDLLAFVPGRVALEVSRTIALKFREATADKCSMSAGVAIFHYKLPVYTALETADILISEVKRREKGKVAYSVVESTGLTKNELIGSMKIRSVEDIEQILNIMDFLRSCEFSSTQLWKIAKLAYNDGFKAEAILRNLMGKFKIGLVSGYSLLEYIKSRFFYEAFFLHNLFKVKGG